MLIRDILGPTKLLEKPQKNSSNKYLGATEKVSNISPVLTGKWGKKQKKLMTKFFGSS